MDLDSHLQRIKTEREAFQQRRRLVWELEARQDGDVQSLSDSSSTPPVARPDTCASASSEALSGGPALKRLRSETPPLMTKSVESAPADPDQECNALRAEFHRVHTNRVACLTFLVRAAQIIEREWTQEPLRLARLAVLRECLLALRGSRHPDLHELSWLGDKIKHLDFPLKHFLVLFLPIERKYTRGLKDDDFLVDTLDNVSSAVTRYPFEVVLDNLRSAFNVGAVFRTADCFGASRIHLCGYTATPADAPTQKASMGAETIVPWEAHPDTPTALRLLRGEGVVVIALETARDSSDLHHFVFPAQARCALVLGNERHGLESSVLELCHHVVRIPCCGVKNSLNVAVAFAVAVYEFGRQHTTSDIIA